MRRWLIPLLVIAIEVALYRRYAVLGAQFHFWLHGLSGAALAFVLLTLVGLARRRPPAGVWAAGLGGHVYSAFPDVLFLLGGVVHTYWMDVFAFHVALHFVPAPLLTMFVVFALSLCAWAAVSLGWRRVAEGLTVAAVAVTAVALLARQPVPATLQQVREHAATHLRQ